MKMKLLTMLAGIAMMLPFASGRAAGVRGFGLTVLVDGSPRSEYESGGTVYIEALRGKDYSLRITNPFPYRVAVALAVDGLNTIDARHTDARSARKWVLDPYETVVISGWQMNGSEARRFYFTGERHSYGSLLGQTDNLGVIEAAFFREKAPLRPPVPIEGELREQSRSSGSAPLPAPAPPGSGAPSERGDSAQKSAPALSDEYAATGIGRKERHDVTWISMELEENPSAVVRIRYEFRPQLVKMGILPPPCRPDPIQRREGAKGFEQAYCPDPFDP